MWNAPKPDGRSPEAEWGFVGSLRADLIEFARENGYKIKQISFKNPDDPSALVADLYRKWNRETLHIQYNSLMVSSFIFIEPWQTIRMGQIPFWTTFSVKQCVDSLRNHLTTTKDKEEAYSKARSFLFSHGTESINIASLDDWKSLLQSQDLLKAPISNDDVFVGVATNKYPKDFSCVVKYNPDMKQKISERYIMPPTMSVNFALDFIEKEGNKYGVNFSTLV